MIAENGVYAERPLQSGQHRRPFIGRYEARHMTMSGDIVTKQNDDIRVERIGVRDDLFDMRERHPGIAGMNVGDGRDLERETGRQSRRVDIVTRHAKRYDRLGKSICRARRTEGAEPGAKLKKLAA